VKLVENLGTKLEYVKDKINGLKTNSKTNNTRDLYKEI